MRRAVWKRKVLPSLQRQRERERETLWLFQVGVETGLRRTDIKMEGSGKEEGEKQDEERKEKGGWKAGEQRRGRGV